MKKRLITLLLALCLCVGLSVPSLAASSENEDNSSINVYVTELEAGYYLCAVWDGDKMLCLFDYTVGSDGVLKTTVDIGEALPDGTHVTVGISSANAGGKEIAPVVCSTYTPSDEPTKPTEPTSPTNPTDPAKPLYSIYIPNVPGGLVTVPMQSYYSGTYVPLTIYPSLGYSLRNISLTDSAGNRVPVSYSGGQYWFTMPRSNVTIYADFVPNTSISTSSAPVTSTITSRPPVTTVPETSPLAINVFASKTGNVGRVSYSVDFSLSATVTGGDGNYSYQFEIKQRGTLTRSTGFTSNPVFSGYITGSGSCIAEITVMDGSGRAAHTTVDVLTGKTITPTEQVSAPRSQSGTTQNTSNPSSTSVPAPGSQTLTVGFSVSSLSVSNYGIQFEVAGRAAGGDGDYLYKFEITQGDRLVGSTEWSDKNGISGKLPGIGKYVLTVMVKDSSGATASTSVNLGA